MKRYVGNGYYYVGFSGCFNINGNNRNKGKKRCLNNGRCIDDKEHLKSLFTEALTQDLAADDVRRFFCVTHDSFIDLIEHSGYEVKIKWRVTRKADIRELFKHWRCDACVDCGHKEACFVCSGSLPDALRDEYLVVFKKKEKK